MRTIPACFVAAALLALTAGPALGLPALSLHLPTLSAPAAPSSAPSKVPILPFAAPGLAMAIRIKDVGSIASKFKTRAQAASNDYAQGVAGAGQDWEVNTKASEPNYEAGVTQAIGQKRFGKGVAAAGAAKYVDNATKLGPQRFQTGIAQAESAYAKGVAPHLDAMRNLTLPPRGPKGSPQNQERANIVAARNRAIKVGS